MSLEFIFVRFGGRVFLIQSLLLYRAVQCSRLMAHQLVMDDGLPDQHIFTTPTAIHSGCSSPPHFQPGRREIFIYMNIIKIYVGAYMSPHMLLYQIHCVPRVCVCVCVCVYVSCVSIDVDVSAGDMDSMTRWMAANDRLLFFPWKKKKKKKKIKQKNNTGDLIKNSGARPFRPAQAPSRHIIERRRRRSTRDGDGSSIRPEPNVM